MHARVNTARVQPEQIDDLVAATQPLLSRAKQEAAGLKSVLLLGDRGIGKIVIVSRWESEAVAEAAEPLYQDAMRELGRFIAEPPTRERYEVLLQE
jgi:quinol monooxygenase YgiN